MRFAIAAPLLLASAGGADAQSPRIDRIEIFERGIYRAKVDRKEESPDTASGTLNIVRNIEKVAETTTIPARLGTRFGIQFRVVGEPSGATVDLTMVTRFPKAGLRNPRTQQLRYQSEYVVKGFIGEERHRSFSFDEEWEMVPGSWVLEVWSGQQKLGEQAFTVVKP
jgi:Domain of unknown function (DUF3859)